MSSARITLKDFLGWNEADLSPDRLSELSASEVYAQVQEQLSAQAGPVWQIVRTQVPGCITKLLDIDGVGILVGVWNKARELRKYRDPAKYPPEDVVVVPLTKHKVESKHRPYLELSVDGKAIGRLQFDIDLALTLEGVELTIQGGRIKKIKTGKALGVATLKCGGVVLHSIDRKLTSLPGVVDLGEGYLIPP
jgi:hypothetical protein